MSVDGVRRRELASFLRRRRERIRPADVGLPTGPRRRAPGLRREEVAVLAGISPAWYSYLEQARDVRPSGEVLDSLARVLRLNEDESRYLHGLVHGPPAHSRPLSGEVSAVDLVAGLVTVLEESPYPVYATDQYCDLLAWNRAALEWYDDWDAAPVRERNILRWMLLSPRARVRLVRWEQDTSDAVARWRAVTSRHSSDPLIRQRITELAHVSPEFRTWWREHKVVEHRSTIRWFRHDELGVQALRIVPLQSPEIVPAGIVMHVPADMAPAASDVPGEH